MTKILIIEDDFDLANMLKSVLEHADFDVETVSNGKLALDYLDRQYVDLIITDIMMPEMDGYEFADALRQIGDEVPILVISAKDDYEAKKLGFRIGVDDYMVKPIDMDEMVLRVAALLRRSRIVNERRLIINDVVLDYDALTVTRKDDVTTLPKKEFYLLFKLLSYPNQIFTRQQLMDEIWGMDAATDERTVDVHIRRLREKFAHYPEFKIVTVRGLGYKAEKLA